MSKRKWKFRRGDKVVHSHRGPCVVENYRTFGEVFVKFPDGETELVSEHWLEHQKRD